MNMEFQLELEKEEEKTEKDIAAWQNNILHWRN